MSNCIEVEKTFQILPNSKRQRVEIPKQQSDSVYSQKSSHSLDDESSGNQCEIIYQSGETNNYFKDYHEFKSVEPNKLYCCNYNGCVKTFAMVKNSVV